MNNVHGLGNLSDTGTLEFSSSVRISSSFGLRHFFFSIPCLNQSFIQTWVRLGALPLSESALHSDSGAPFFTSSARINLPFRLGRAFFHFLYPNQPFHSDSDARPLPSPVRIEHSLPDLAKLKRYVAQASLIHSFVSFFYIIPFHIYIRPDSLKQIKYRVHFFCRKTI